MVNNKSNIQELTNWAILNYNLVCRHNRKCVVLNIVLDWKCISLNDECVLIIGKCNIECKKLAPSIYRTYL